MKSLKEKFISLLKNEDFLEAEKILEEGVFYTEDLMDQKTDEEYQKIEPHWSAVNCGEVITSPLKDLKKISDALNFKDQKHLVDLGSGHAYPSFIFASLYPHLKISNCELVEEKNLGAQRTCQKLNLEKQIQFFKLDLSVDPPPKGDLYYIYNPFNQEVMDRLADELEQISKFKKIQIIAAGERVFKSLNSYFKDLEVTGLPEDFKVFAN